MSFMDTLIAIRMHVDVDIVFHAFVIHLWLFVFNRPKSRIMHLMVMISMLFEMITKWQIYFPSGSLW